MYACVCDLSKLSYVCIISKGVPYEVKIHVN